MTFFETNLNEMIKNCILLKNPKLVGNACVARLTDDITVKIKFTDDGYADHYSAIYIKVINRNVGEIDGLTIKFKDIWNCKGNICVTSNLSGEKGWYGEKPSSVEYVKIANAITDYLENFI